MKIYIETNMRKMPNSNRPCDFLIKIPKKEYQQKCSLSVIMLGEIVDCCKQNCPLKTEYEILEKEMEEK